MPHHGSNHVPLADYYRDIDPGAEFLRGAWVDPIGAEYLDRHRPSEGEWAAPEPEPQGYVHFFIQGGAFQVNDERDGARLAQGLRHAGTVRLCRPEDNIRKTGIGPARCLQVSLTPSVLEQSLSDLRARPVNLDALDLGPQTDLGLGRLLIAHREMLELGYSGEQLYFQIIRQAILSRLLIWRLGTPADPRPFRETLPAGRVRRAIDYIEGNLAEPLRLSELAALARTSKFHFSRAFANTIGISPQAFVRQRRLKRAAKLLKTGVLTVREVAALCGFADIAHLSRMFRTHLGIPPSEARKRSTGYGGASST
jgi:AraC family transcriptional regulator